MDKIVFKKSADPFQSAGLAALIDRLRKQELNDTVWRIEEESLIIESNTLSNILLDVYEEVGRDYYDTSTLKQKKEMAGFYYDTKQKKLITYAKVKPIGFSQLINNSRPMPKASSMKYKELDHDIQDIIKQEASNHGIKFNEKDTIYINDRNTAIPELADFNIQPGSNTCITCGESYKYTSETVKFSPFLGGKSAGLGFVSQTRKPEQVCWKCMYLYRLSVGKFVYNTEIKGKDQKVHSFFFDVNTLEGLDWVNNKLLPLSFLYSRRQREDCGFRRNFDFFYEGRKIISTTHFHEELLALLYTLYEKYQTVKSENSEVAKYLGFENTLLYHTSVFYINAKKFGPTLRPQASGNYNDLDYLFRLFDLMHVPAVGKIDMYSVYLHTVDYSVISKPGKKRYDIALLSRNKIAERILFKRTISDILEEIVCKPENHKHNDMLTFLKLYESYINYGGNMAMNDEIRDFALYLGYKIGTAVVKDKGNTKIGKAKIIQLRKSRSLESFLDVVISIQSRFGIQIDKKLLDSINVDNFNYVRQFCVINALNTISSVEHKKNKQEVPNEQ
ncbi:hypothetical protein MASR1M36_20330 [Candidatus Cloacimonadaceae bacterium]